MSWVTLDVASGPVSEPRQEFYILRNSSFRFSLGQAGETRRARKFAPRVFRACLAWPKGNENDCYAG